MNKRKIIGVPTLQRGVCITQCTEVDTSNLDDPQPRCSGALWSTGEVTGSCGDPCSFIMRKGGAGNPPFMAEDQIVDEIQKLLMRRSRGNVRYD